MVHNFLAVLALFLLTCSSTYILQIPHYIHIRIYMQEEVLESQSSVIEEGETIQVKIKMQPQSLHVQLPLRWQINQVKCLLTTMVPKLEFGMIKLTYQGVEIPGRMTLDEVLVGDSEREYLDRGLLEIVFSRKENQPEEFEKYYSEKMTPLLNSIKRSPFQPVLYPKYYSLMNELVQIQSLSKETLKNNLRNYVNLRQFLGIPNRNLENQNQNNNQNNNQDAEEAAMAEGMGVLGPRPGNNANIFERGGFFVFKALQIFLLWQLISLVFNHINAWHILILVGIVVAYLCIDHFKKAKNDPNAQSGQPEPKEEGKTTQTKYQSEQEAVPQKDHSTETGERNEDSPQEESDRPYSSLKVPKEVPKWMLRWMQISCVLCESIISFIMSLFPNWTIQLHNNLFRDKFQKIDQLFQLWRAEKGERSNPEPANSDLVEGEESVEKEVLVKESNEDKDFLQERKEEIEK